ncbi:hypothetical protein BTS2_3315 [Bacillus sp. TS-2]|nr:hypothetical protein BTS2_3315 [Bacillus sp. TS-2]
MNNKEINQLVKKANYFLIKRTGKGFCEGNVLANKLEVHDIPDFFYELVTKEIIPYHSYLIRYTMSSDIDCYEDMMTEFVIYNWNTKEVKGWVSLDEVIEENEEGLFEGLLKEGFIKILKVLYQ